MVNLDVLIKWVRNKGHKYDWPVHVRAMRDRQREVREGFQGIGQEAISLVPFGQIKEGELFIWDLYIEDLDRYGDEAPLLLKKLENGKALIEGIGFGYDSERDPDRIKFRWMDTIDMPEISSDFPVYRIDSRSNVETGGNLYFYTHKCYRDLRW